MILKRIKILTLTLIFILFIIQIFFQEKMFLNFSYVFFFGILISFFYFFFNDKKNIKLLKNVDWCDQIKILNYISSTENFKMIFLVSIFLSVYGGFFLGASSQNFVDSIFKCFQSPVFNILMFSLLLLNTINTCSIFKKQFKNFQNAKKKKNYLFENIKAVILLNLFFLAVFFLLYFIVLNIFKINSVNIHQYYNYHVNNLVYALFFLVRYVAFTLLLCLITAISYVKYNKIITVIIDVVFLLGFIIYPLNNGIVDKFCEFAISPFVYYLPGTYSSFTIEFIYSFAYLIGLILFICLLYKIPTKTKKLSNVKKVRNQIKSF